MNRRLMMQQQNKGFELVYNAASGTLPTEQGWKFRYLMYGYSIGGTQSMSDSLLNVNVQHVYEVCSYHIEDKPSAKNCELSITVESITGVDNLSVMGILLTDGEKAMELVIGSRWGGFALRNQGRFGTTKLSGALVVNTSFKVKMRLSKGVITVWINDELAAETADLFNVSEIYTIENAIADGTPKYNSFPYLFRDVRNSISFSSGGVYQVSNITYKEW